MAKGKTSAPLSIAVPSHWLERPEVQELVAQGHAVYPVDLMAFDLVLSPHAHQWNEFMAVEETRKNGTKYRPYLDAAVTAARKRKREAK